jgi:hypothetical protein
MPNITSKMGRYCAIHRYYHNDEYLECDFCNEHKWGVYFHDRYYNYGFSKCSYHACIECEDTLYGPFRPGDVLIAERAYEDILEVINERTFDRPNDIATTTIDFSPLFAYTEREYLRKFIEREKNVEEINKRFRLLWSL